MSRLLIQCSHIYLSFGSLQLFEDLSLSISQGEIFALIGENGAGKTTLLQLIRGQLMPDAGHIHKAEHLSIGFLPQEIIHFPDTTVRSYLEEGQLAELERRMAVLLQYPDRLDEWAELHEKYETLGGYKRMPLEKVLSGLKLESAILDQPMARISSGQRVRVALSKALIDNPDLLLLDEPTNHLDASMLEWLQTTLHMREGATIIVSHDRKFLNRACSRLLEIKNGSVVCYGGNYDFYLAEQEASLQRRLQAYETQEEERKLLHQKIKAMTFSKGKPPAPRDRNIMAYDRRGEQHQKSLARSLDMLKTRLAEIEAHPLPHPRPKGIKGLVFAPASLASPLASTVAIELDHICKAFGQKNILTDFSKTFCKGDRIVLRGPNGVGKTTLLRCLANHLELDSGQIRYAPTTKIAYLDQQVTLLPMQKTPYEYFLERFLLSEEVVRRELHKAAIGGAELLARPFSTLSVGQRKRFMLLSLIFEKPNVLLLDEPTNHLDLMTVEALEKALLQFEGVIVAVSHDQMFIDKIATEILDLAG